MTGSANEYRRGRLALTLQEAFTAAARLRANRQVAADAASFRSHIKRLLRTADEEARRWGYSGENVKLAIYAFVVFLDESVLNSPQPMFNEWPRKPLQEEIFGGHVGGEVFFQNLRDLLSQQDSADVADLLEVYQLCLLLGYKGRYSTEDRGELHSLLSATSEKIGRIRGSDALSPSWAPPRGERLPPARDPWIQRLAFSALGTFAFAVVLFVIFRLSLRSGLEALRELALRLV